MTSAPPPIPTSLSPATAWACAKSVQRHRDVGDDLSPCPSFLSRHVTGSADPPHRTVGAGPDIHETSRYLDPGVGIVLDIGVSPAEESGSVAGQLVGGGSSGAGGPAQEVGEQVEFGIAVSGADLVQ